MGNRCPACPVMRYNCCISSRRSLDNGCHENHTSTPKHSFKKSAKQGLPFFVCDADMMNDLININTATEEELMTLPSINRQTRKISHLGLYSSMKATLSWILDPTIQKNKDLLKNSQDLTKITHFLTKKSKVEVFCNFYSLDGNAHAAKLVYYHSAHNIIEYRRQIGGAFNKVEDLVLVSGVGATKLNQFRAEVCVDDHMRTKQQGSCGNGSRDSLNEVVRPRALCNSTMGSNHKGELFDGPDDEDIISGGSGSRSPSCDSRVRHWYHDTRININTSNVFQLMKVRGITQTIAENVVAYRDRKGEFKRVDDLRKVKGINASLLDVIRLYLVLRDEPELTTENTLQAIDASHAQHLDHSNNELDGTVAKLLSSSGLDEEQRELISLYAPLLKKSLRHSRMDCSETSAGSVARNDIVRVASWNLDSCGVEKVNNPGVQEVFSMTLLENRFGLVAIQHLTDRLALQKLCDELNDPDIPAVKRCSDPHRKWKCVISPASDNAQSSINIGFLYNEAEGIEMVRVEPIRCDSPLVVSAVGIFKIRSLWEVAVVNTQLLNEKDDELISKDTMLQFVSRIAIRTEGIKSIMVVGSLSTAGNAKVMVPMSEAGYQCILGLDCFTDISTQCTRGSACTQNICPADEALEHFTRNYGVVREGLTSAWIPNGWQWGGYISAYCPVWAEFSIYPVVNIISNNKQEVPG